MLFIHVLRALCRMLLYIGGSIKISGRSNLPSGPYLLVTNHMSAADAPLLYVAMPKEHLTRLRFFAGEKWERHPLFGPLMRWTGAIYINRGTVDRRALREAIKAIEGGDIFGLAPEGTRSRVGQLIEGRDGAAYLAVRANMPIVPVGVVNTDRWSHEIRRLRRVAFEARIGEPFELPDLGRRPKGRDLSAYTHLIMVHIAALLPPRYHGFYAESPALEALLSGEDPWPHCLAVAGVDEGDTDEVVVPPRSRGEEQLPNET